MEVHKMTCTVCPNSCEMTINMADSRQLDVQGAGCKRGELFARGELLSPMRILTSSILLIGGAEPLLPVRSDKAILRERLFDCMAVIRDTIAYAPVAQGAILIHNICDTGANMIASCDITT